MRTRQTLTLGGSWMLAGVLVASVCACGDGSRRGGSAEVVGARAPSQNYPSATIASQMDASDTADSVRLEQAVADMVGLLRLADEEARRQALRQLVDEYASQPEAFGRVDRLVRKYLDDPNSPLRDEEIFIIYLEAVVARPDAPEHLRERASFSLAEARLNRPGALAADFPLLVRKPACTGSEAPRSSYAAPGSTRTQTLSSRATVGRPSSYAATKQARTARATVGRPSFYQSSLRKIAERDTVLVVFHDPECEQCHKMIKRLAESNLSANLRILAVDVTGDRPRWERDEQSLPAGWMDAFAVSSIEDEGLYAFPALPSLYLLAPGARVIAKDFPL